jgi:endonuclease III
MLWDNADVAELQNLVNVPIPVDIHVARATLALGVVRGEYRGKLEELFKYVRDVWRDSMRGLRVEDREMIALDVDEPLWHLSKHGCVKRDAETGACLAQQACEVGEFCTEGRIKITKLREIDLQT